MVHVVPQPSPARLTEFRGHPVVVGVVPRQDPLVALTAASLARANRTDVVFGYVDQDRYAVREFDDGTTDHRPINPDGPDDAWRITQDALEAALAETMADQGVTWHFRYLAGRVDRSLTHLARAVDASTIVIGARHAGMAGRMQDFFDGSVALQLTHHQHRPVLVVPLKVTDWKDQPTWR